MEERVAKISGLSKEQKIGFILLLVFAFFTIGLGAMQIRNTMYSNFALKNSIPLGVSDKINTVDALRFRDTDKDGLSDYDELYVYGTSPYLADTDGDGISDKEEITKGTDPLCPTGKICSAEVTNQGSTSTTIDNLPPAPTGLSAPELLSKLQNPTEVRKMLLDSGVKKDILDKINDTDLMKMVQEMMSPNAGLPTSSTLFVTSTP